MRLKSFIPCLLAALAVATLPAQKNPTFTIEGDGVGYVLLNDVVKLFEYMAPAAGDFRDKVMQGLDQLFGESSLACEQKLVDAAFLERYQRVLVVLKLVILKSVPDDAGVMEKGKLKPGAAAKGGADPILDSLIIREVNRFDIAEKMAEGTNVQGIGSVAGAVAAELLSLKKYLDKLPKTPVS